MRRREQKTRRIAIWLGATAFATAVWGSSGLAFGAPSQSSSSGQGPIKPGVNDSAAIRVRTALGYPVDAATLASLPARSDLVNSVLGIYLTAAENADLQRRLRTSETLPALKELLQTTYGAYYAGVGTDQKLGGILHILLTPGYPSQASAEIAATLPNDAKYEIDTAQYTLSDLQDTLSRIAGPDNYTLLSEGAVIRSYAIDEIANHVEVTTASAAKAATESALAKLYGYRVVVSVDDASYAPADRNTAGTYLIDGQNVHSGGYCSAGFAAYTPDGHDWIITAGHCEGTTWYIGTTSKYPFGPMHKSLWRNDSYCDCETVGPVSTTQTWGRPTNEIYHQQGSSYSIRAFAYSINYLSQGDIVEFSGASGGGSGHLVDATVTSLSAPVTYTENGRQTTINAQVKANTINANVLPGDSGGPVYNFVSGGVQLDGIVSGAANSSVLVFTPTWTIRDATIGLNSTPFEFTP